MDDSDVMQAFRDLAHHAIAERYARPVIVRHAGMDMPAGVTVIDGVEIVASAAFPPDKLYVMERDELDRIMDEMRQASQEGQN